MTDSLTYYCSHCGKKTVSGIECDHKPVMFLPDCEWQGNVKEKPGVTVCFRHYLRDRTTRFANYMQPCSKGCMSPTKGKRND